MKILLAFLFAVNIFGADNPDFISTYYYAPSITINFETWKGSPLSIKIISEENVLIYKDKLNTSDTHGIQYNLHTLKDGKYSVILENEEKIVKEKIILFDGKIVEKDAVVTYKPNISLKKDLVNVSFMSPNQEVWITIFKGKEVIFKNAYLSNDVVEEFFNIQYLSSGTYKVVITNGLLTKSIKFKK